MQKTFNNFTYNDKCTIWRISFKEKDKEYNLKNYYGEDYNILIYNNDKNYQGNCINNLNCYLGELCTMYYVWKNNLKSDIVGFDQYRRQWTQIDFDKINNNYIQTYTHFEVCDKIINQKYFSEIGCFLYQMLLYIKFYYPEYSDKLNSLLQHQKYICDYVNIFICKWEIFDKICKIVFGFLDYVLPNNQWMNKDKLNEYINFNYNFHININNETINPKRKGAILSKSCRQYSFLLECIFGIIYALISKTYEDPNTNNPLYFICYECNSIDDYNNILKTYKYSVGNGVNFTAFLIYDHINIFKKTKNTEYFLLNINNGENWIRNDKIYNGNYIKFLCKHRKKIVLKPNEYINTQSSIEFNKGNYIIKQIDE